MKDLIPNTHKEPLVPFITDYVIDGNKIEIHYSNYMPTRVPYSAKQEKMIVEEMKKQAKQVIEYEREYKKDIERNRILALSNTALSFACVALALHNYDNNMKYLDILAALASAGSVALTSKAIRIDKSKLKDIEKYRFFLQNEKTINDDIIDRYHEMYGINAPIEDANLLTFNNIDQYTLTELVERVKNIEASDDYLLSLRRK